MNNFSTPTSPKKKTTNTEMQKKKGDISRASEQEKKLSSLCFFFSKGKRSWRTIRDPGAGAPPSLMEFHRSTSLGRRRCRDRAQAFVEGLSSHLNATDVSRGAITSDGRLLTRALPSAQPAKPSQATLLFLRSSLRKTRYCHHPPGGLPFYESKVDEDGSRTRV